MVQLFFILILLAVIIAYWYVFVAIIAGGVVLWIFLKTGALMFRIIDEQKHQESMEDRYGDDYAQFQHTHPPRPKLPDPHPVVNAVPSTPPSLFLPLFWMLWSGFWLIFWTALTVLPPYRADAELLFWLVFSIATFLPSLAWYQRRIEARQEWRKARGVAWVFKDPLKAPEMTDWEKYERDLKVTF